MSKTGQRHSPHMMVSGESGPLFSGLKCNIQPGIKEDRPRLIFIIAFVV